MSGVEVRLQPVAVCELRPTQMTVGFREVAVKRRAWRMKSGEERKAFLSRQLAPTVIGPGGRQYIIDQHHLSRALFEEGQAQALVNPIADFSDLDEGAFWAEMDARHWIHPYDAAGRRKAYSDLPKSVAGLADDPWRSLAAMVRRAGGFAKDTAPYSEFAWADFFRVRLGAPAVRAALAGELAHIVALARSLDAKHLPGWRGAP